MVWVSGVGAADAQNKRELARIPIPLSGQQRVTRVRVGAHPEKTRVVLDVSSPTEFHFRLGADGQTILVDLPHAGWSATPSLPRTQRGVVARVAFTPFSDKGGRLNIDTRHPVRLSKPLVLAPAGGRGYRIVFDLHPVKPAAAAATTSKNFVRSGGSSGADRVVEAAHRQPVNSAGPSQRPIPPAASPQPNPYLVAAGVIGPNGERLDPVQAAAAIPQRGQVAQIPPRSQLPGRPPPSPFPLPQDPPRSFFAGLEGLYARSLGGVSFLTGTTNEGASNNNSTEYEAGFVFNGAIGMDLDNGFRLEAEATYAINDLKTINGTANAVAVNTGSVDGDVTSLAFMANVAYDLPNESRFTPYLFGGASLTGVFLNEVQALGAITADDSDWVFALQGGVGFTLEIDQRLSLEGMYKYFEAHQPEFNDSSGNPFASEYSSHQLMLGARYKF